MAWVLDGTITSNSITLAGAGLDAKARLDRKV